MFRQYVLPWFVEEGQEACDVELRNTRRELTIHWRSGGLLNLPRISSRFAPCACFEKVAHDFEFTRLRIITKTVMKQPCIKALNSSQSPFEMIIPTKSKVEDACALMCAKHLVVEAMSSFSPGKDAEVVIAPDNTFLHDFTARWLFSYFQQLGLQERAGEVLLPDELTELCTRDLFLASFPGPSGHACVYGYLSALNL